MRKALYILGTLNDHDVDWLSEAGTTRLLEPGELVIKEGRPVDTLFIVLEGELLVFSGIMEIARLPAGEIVGEISFVDARPPSASVKAAIKSSVLGIPAEVLRAKLAKDSNFASRFYRAVAVFLADRLRHTTSRFGYGSAKQDGASVASTDEVNPELHDSLDQAAARFDKLLRGIAARSAG
ncbi:MAG: cyclic nucleotide-binding domain-containing protein [Acidobacteria bacterium]|nr:cyclic nucleotide-binding domain-containing protein [Acidobacteriota bacterium]MBV9144982.1 cyclic nucleotide-binding domain-containing protein [Acidobacteriota bacterium]MBV9437502.1 cyclic nucleotide-binding domain-containing protein [Acidobacteriota bacterium]